MLEWINKTKVPHALQIGFPSSSLLHKGVFVVPQFWHCISVWTLPEWGFGPGAISAYCVSFTALLATIVAATAAACAALATRLLNAGHPLQLELPPVPSQWPSPGHVPWGACCFKVAAAIAPAAAAAESDGGSCLMDCTSFGVGGKGADVRLLMFGGRDVCRAFSYNPQALQIIFPFISRLHNGVEVVPQFLQH